MPTLLSVNIGKPQPVGDRRRLTGIFKQPVAGPVTIGPLGIDTDAVLDTKHHGGVDQALYLYLQSDYDWWSAELGQTLAPGTFGENLTIEGIDGDRLGVGDRFTVGEVELEITSHRTPCNTFADRMGDRRWVKRFHQAGRPGAYVRVLRPGLVQAGDPVLYTPFPGEPVTVRELMALDGVRTIPEPVLRRALQAPVHWKLRRDFTDRLAATAP